VLGGALADPVDGVILLLRGESPEVAGSFARTDPGLLNGLVRRWRVREGTTVVGGGRGESGASETGLGARTNPGRAGRSRADAGERAIDCGLGQSIRWNCQTASDMNTHENPTSQATLSGIDCTSAGLPAPSSTPRNASTP
jgi:hypothetical protein